MKAKIGALAITALILMVAVPAVSAGTYEVVPTVSAGPFEDARENYKVARGAFQSAFTAWLTARSDFLTARAAWRQNRTNQTLITNLHNAAKNSLLAADNMIIKRLEALKARVEATRGISDNEKPAIIEEIDNDISWLQGKQSEIQAAENGQQIRSVATTIWNYWKTVRVRVKQIVGQILSAWVDAIIQRGEAFAGKIEARIEELKGNGVDTSQLESWLTDYNSKLTLAEGKYDAAKAKFEEISDESTAGKLFREGIAFIREGNSYLKEAFKALKNIVSDMRSKGHSVTLTGSGTLVAKGDGSAYISGTGMVKVRATIQGTMLVSSDAEVTTTGTGTKTVLDNGWVQYQGYGSARVTGSGIEVNISGNGIDILASGTGTATLKGTGTYRTYGNKYWSGSWTATGTTATLSTGEVSVVA